MFRSSSSHRPYRDRTHAGRVLAARLEHLREREDVLVVALPRGGVPVAAPIVAALHAPLEVLLVRKLGVPGRPELAAGAIAAGGLVVTNDDIIAATHTTPAHLDAVIAAERAELRRRERAYGVDSGAASSGVGSIGVDVTGATVVVVDDGVATGATMRAALEVIRAGGARRSVVAVPVGPVDVAALFPAADDVICVCRPPDFRGVGAAYEDFTQLTDAEVRGALGRDDIGR